MVSANAELLEREIGENQWLSNIQYENERMGALVTQLLDLARMENVAPQMETVDFSHLVSGETLPFESVMYEKGMVFNCDIQDKILVHGNSMQLKQITAILLDNAVKHSTAGGEIQLLCLAAHGTGHGFPPALHLLFHVSSQLVLGAGVAELVRQNLIHGIRHFPGNGGGGGVIQINHRDNSFSWDLP